MMQVWFTLVKRLQKYGRSKFAVKMKSKNDVDAFQRLSFSPNVTKQVTWTLATRTTLGAIHELWWPAILQLFNLQGWTVSHLKDLIHIYLEPSAQVRDTLWARLAQEVRK